MDSSYSVGPRFVVQIGEKVIDYNEDFRYVNKRTGLLTSLIFLWLVNRLKLNLCSLVIFRRVCSLFQGLRLILVTSKLCFNVICFFFSYILKGWE